MTYSRRRFLESGAVLAVAAALPMRAADAWQADGRTLTPEMFGAKGDGRTNDSAAFEQLAAIVSGNGGGTVSLGAGKTYIVGVQHASQGGQYGYAPAKLLEFRGCSEPLIIRGNGARIKCAPGLRYGTFDSRTGRATRNPMPYLGQGELATPYMAMIHVEDCSGPIEITDVELDGSVEKLLIGGEYGDTGRQIPADGIFLRNNRGSELIRNVHSHHHARDGLVIDGLDRDGGARRLIRGLRSEYNCRQGCSIVGGLGYIFEDCRFNHTGKAVFTSAPGAGVDIEAEGSKKNRNFSFTRCEFSNNSGCGMVADSGDSEGATFTDCRFIGTTSWAAWPFKPRFRFDGCTFVGASVKAYGDRDPSRAAQFHDCTFLDDPRLAPGGKVYMGGKKHYFIYDLSSELNVRFSNCTFRLRHDGLLPWSWHAIYENCTMSQRASEAAYPKGKYLGRSTLTGPVDLYGTNVIGTLVLNGRTISREQLGGETW